MGPQVRGRRTRQFNSLHYPESGPKVNLASVVLIKAAFRRILHKVRGAAGELMARAVSGGLSGGRPGGGSPRRQAVFPTAGNSLPLSCSTIGTHSNYTGRFQSIGFTL